MLKVIDTDTDRTGKLVRSAGYVMNGAYVNPSWEISWDDWEDEDESEEDD